MPKLAAAVPVPFFVEVAMTSDERMQSVIREALLAVTDPQPEHVIDAGVRPSHRHTFIFSIPEAYEEDRFGGQLLVERWADGTVTVAHRPEIGHGSWGPPCEGRDVS